MKKKKKRKRAAKKPREPPLVPDMQAKLAEWKETEKECKWGCVRQSTEGPEMALFLSAWWRNHLFSLNLGQDNENRDSIVGQQRLAYNLEIPLATSKGMRPFDAPWKRGEKEKQSL